MKSLLTTLALSLLAAPAFTQDTPKPDTEKRVADLERKLDILSKQLEAQQTGTVEAPEQGRFGLGSAASKVYESKGGLSIGGYGEFLYQNFEKTLQNDSRAPKTNSLDALRLVLYTGYKFNERIVFNSEVEFEHGGFGDESVEGEAVVEFAYLDFLLNKAVNVRAGMVLLPVGFINEGHEPPTFLGSRRPITETKIIPATWHENGIGIHGELPQNLSYQLFLVNGLSAKKFGPGGIRDGRQAGSVTQAGSFAWTGRLDWNFMPGALVGGSFYSGNSSQEDGAPRITTSLFDVHAEFRAAGWQLRGIYAKVTNSKDGIAALSAVEEARQVGTDQFGGYLEVGYDLLRSGGTKQALIPFLRWERLNTQGTVVPDVAKDLADDQTILTVGVNYKPIPQVVVKADYQKIENRARTGRNQVNVALGYYF